MTPREPVTTAIMPTIPAVANVSRQISGASAVSSAPSDIRPGRMKWRDTTKASRRRPGSWVISLWRNWTTTHQNPSNVNDTADVVA